MASPPSLLQMLQGYLQVTQNRQQVVAANMANVDTPGYRTKDIDFQGELARAMQGQPADQTEPFVHEVTGLVTRPDGNNVSIDRESLLLSEVQLQFGIAEQLLKSDFKTLQMAITEGGASA